MSAATASRPTTPNDPGVNAQRPPAKPNDRASVPRVGPALHITRVGYHPQERNELGQPLPQRPMLIERAAMIVRVLDKPGYCHMLVFGDPERGEGDTTQMAVQSAEVAAGTGSQIWWAPMPVHQG